MAVSLPQDVILFQVISRVPTKIAVRFKCVSKQWNSFLMSNRFKEMHNDRNVYPNLEDQNLFFLSEKSATFYTMDCESPPDNTPCSRPLPQFATHPPEYIDILTSFHGLVCLGIKNKDFEIILWNPVTKEYKRLSKLSNPDHMECYIEKGSGYGLYYCSGENDYKLLVVTDSSYAYIYSLKSDSWRKLDTMPPIIQDIWTPGFCLNKYLYFLCYNMNDPDKLHHEGRPMSMRYDTKANRFLTIKPPPLLDGMFESSSIANSVHKGSIHLFVMYDNNWSIGCTCIELWKFIADRDIWRKMVTYQLKLPNTYLSRFSLYPVHLMSNGNLLMIDAHEPVHICQVDLTKKKYPKDNHKEDKNKSVTGNNHDEYKLLYHFESTVDWSYDEVRYTETFVSPNQYMK